jgi:hypothetical protein
MGRCGEASSCTDIVECSTDWFRDLFTVLNGSSNGRCNGRFLSVAPDCWDRTRENRAPDVVRKLVAAPEPGHVLRLPLAISQWKVRIERSRYDVVGCQNPIRYDGIDDCDCPAGGSGPCSSCFVTGAPA